jgi:transcriptional regulator with XRE-family HTH domain
MPTFGEWLETQFSQTPAPAREIARIAEVSPGYLSGLRNSLRASPSPDAARRIARAFAVARALQPQQTAALEEEALRVALDSKQSARRTRLTTTNAGEPRWERLNERWARTA